MVWAIVMAGGQGERLWPASRKNCPKQFIQLFAGKSLIELTVARVSKVIPPKRIFVITDSAQQGRVRRLFPGIPPHQVIGEPAGRNTAATIALGTSLILQQDSQAIVTVFPSDHAIFEHRGFKRSVLLASRCAEKKKCVVVLGVKPRYAATAYGYVEVQSKASSGGAFKIRRFVEKPNAQNALRFSRNPKYYWHAGILVADAVSLTHALRRHLPRHFRVARRLASVWKRKAGVFPLPRLFVGLPSISIDYGVLEKMREVWMVRAGFDWNDVGSWNALESVWAKDKDANAVNGRFAGFGARGNIVYSPKAMTALVGVCDLIVVNTPEALLVASKQEAETVKDLVKILKQKKLTARCL